MKEAFSFVVILGILTTASSYCPIDQIHGLGHCSIQAQCYETIKDITGLAPECLGSSNYEVRVEITLRNATDSFHIIGDENFISLVTALTVVANWPQTALSFLHTMINLKQLSLVKCNIQKINDTPFRNLMYLENVDLSHNSINDIEELFQFETRPFRMRKLSLAYNCIEEVPGDTFEELASLYELDLSYNFITELSEEPFYNLTNLRVLRLNNNRIKELNGAINNLINLRHLYLGYNDIQNIDMKSLKTISHLQTFDISKNRIEDLKKTMLFRHWGHFNKEPYCRIVISGNHITLLPNSTDIFEELSKNLKRNANHKKVEVMTDLDLSENAISHIEYNAFKSIAKLISLDLAHNKLTNFYVDSDDLIYVQYLNLSCNYLRILQYASFSSMQNLQNLDISHNQMEFFPDQSLMNTNKIKVINATHNEIAEINNLRITFHPEGGILDLSNNGLEALNIPTDEALGLTELILESNNIKDAYLIKLIDQHDLRRLDMSKNLIRELDESSLQLPDSLVYLDLSYNQIERIAPSCFRYLGQLKTLRLSHNRLRNIDYGVFQGLTKLLNLDLAFNSIEYLDSKVFMDLKSLSILSLRNNGLHFFDHDIWLNRNQDVMIYLDGNSLSCEWLAKALSDYNNGYSKMHPIVFNPTGNGNSIEGVPCKQEVGELSSQPNVVMDERLLMISQKILEAVQNQTSILKKNLWKFLLQDASRKEAMNNSIV